MIENKIDIILLDKSKNLTDEINILKSKTFPDLLNAVNNNFINLPKYKKLVYQEEKNYNNK